MLKFVLIDYINFLGFNYIFSGFISSPLFSLYGFKFVSQHVLSPNYSFWLFSENQKSENTKHYCLNNLISLILSKDKC